MSNIDTSKVITLAQAVAAEKRGNREGANLTRREFCIVLFEQGVLTAEDALSAAKGEWPTATDSFLSFLTPEQSSTIQIEWAATSVIERLNPFVLTLGSWLGLSDIELDTLFGVE